MPVVSCPHCSNPVTLPPTWTGTAYTCPHCRRVAGGSPPPPPRPAPPPAPPRPTPSQPVMLPPPPPPPLSFDDDRSDSDPAPRRRYQNSTTFADFASFRLMITPLIIQIIFWVGVGGCVLTGGYLMVNSFSTTTAVVSRASSDDDDDPPPAKTGAKSTSPKTTSSTRFSFGTFFMGILVMTVGPVMIRVACELDIILFKIHDELKVANDRRGRI